MDLNPSVATPFRQFVIKLNSRCDLSCDHCYVYEHADTSWRGRPKVPLDDVLVQTAARIAEHARVHRLERVHVVLHGGEPLLAGPIRLRRAAQVLNDALRGVCELDLRIHTNAVTLGERHLRIFDEFHVKVGVSLDGDRAANDLHRRYANGHSSYHQVVRAIDLLRLPRWRHLYAGLLCTVDVRNDPVAVYDALVALDPPRIDFLLPHATWDEPPLRPDGPGTTPYAEWLGRVYERWNAQGRPVPVRMFDSLHRTLRGQSSLTESLGLAPADLVVVETDGTLEQADSLKTAYDGAAATGFDVFRHDFDTAARHPGMIDRQQGLDGLSAQCRACPVVESCGGGLYAHRYRSADGGFHAVDGGFDNPSVFCPDLLALITAVRDAERARKEHHPMSTGLLSDPHFDELASGYGGAGAVDALRVAQVEVNRALLDRVAEAWSAAPAPDADAEADLPYGDAWELIALLDESAPEALDRAVAHPFTRSWALECLAQPGPLAERFGGVAELAVAAALFAKADGKLTLPVRPGGELRVPGHGVLTGVEGGSALVLTEHDRFVVETAQERIEVELRAPQREPRWRPVRPLSGDAGAPEPRAGVWRLLLDDTDPQRRAHHWDPAAPMSDAEADAWQAELAAAWRVIDATLPGYAPGLRAGLSTVVPLRPSADGSYVSGAARDLFGTVGIARPGSAEFMALLLIHEFQHVKLGAVFDMEDLFDRSDTRTFDAPWRPDPRPFEGLFQGTYAHIAVVEFWRSRWRATHAREDRAEYTRWLDHTYRAIGVMTDSGALTDRGRRFVAGMRATVEPWVREES
ncbi:FxsB family cyclophane-forming radical SAM/SPASM peptide maturase [Streptacidiphilus fuscans]|uniref:FxsB family radical SAM/SPASM domain protein n=1 Tax=Streptacidiphilus fuscans TaxID=2789292 RepID=A0A931B9E8_9ACTN|nr:FxsB family cyclophane-forming radical SAM/SPASM peptide maturase [Streptacidiphilus fuscans]MBF9072158.1 FxsB family radical SAM/SPASM domain protein [Streptacidiphilus fuscans]MBF9072969.1 FxsB family radical SAM/SPASM domain protein [Streptacidiphilus fuscans]